MATRKRLPNLFTPTRKPVRVEQGRDGRRRTVYDQPKTPWARVLKHDAANAILDGRGECAAMPHADTLRIMELMDSIRAAWGLSYPFE